MTTTFQQRAIWSTALLAAVCATVCAFDSTTQAAATVQTVEITAQRMSQSEKIAYDTAFQPVQTVLISARRLSEQEKLAYDQSERMPAASLAQGAGARVAI